jgi:type IV secretory pathway VirB4 component
MSPHYVSEIIPWGSFIDDSLGRKEAPPERRDAVVRLRGGGTTVGYEIEGPGHETTSAADVIAACERFTNSLTHFGTGDFVHLIVHRVPATGYPARAYSNRAAGLVDRERKGRFEQEHYYRNLVRFYVSNQDESAIANYLKALFFASTEHRLRSSRELQLQRFLHRLEKWEDVIASTLKPRRLTRLEMFRDLLLTVNGIYYDAPLPRPGAPLHHIIGQQDFAGGSLPRMGEFHIRPVTLVYPWPKATAEQALSVLLTHPGELMLSCRFVCLDPPDAERVLKLERRRYITEANGTGVKQWFVNSFNLKKRATADQDVEEQIAECDEALTLLAQGMPFGWATITAFVRGREEQAVNSRARQLVKDLADIQHGARIEDAMAVEAIKGGWPGQGAANERRPLISAANFADLALPIHHWEGTPAIDSTFFPEGTAAPLIVTGSGNEPFYAPSHIRSVGHQLIIGPTTAGKSVLLGVIVQALSVLPGVRIIWLDRDYSSFVLTHAMGGTYIELATDNSSPLCPFQWLMREQDTGWLFDWFVRLGKRWNIDLTERQAADLDTALTLAKATGICTMTAFIHLVHDPQLRGVLRNYAAGGQRGHIFDGEPAAPGRTMLTTYEMRHLDALGERASGPATELIVHDAEAALGATPTFVVIDEGKWLLSSPIALPWVDKALRTFRKYNAAIILATQSLAEIESTEVRSLLLESTAVKIFLPNRAAAGEHVRALYQQLGLTEKELEIIATAIPQRDYLCSTEYGARLFRLDLGPMAKALCASTGSNAVAQARRMLAGFGPERFLDAWLHLHGLGPAPEAPALPDQLPEILHSNGRVPHALN